jgi:hypothetical protein
MLPDQNRRGKSGSLYLKCRWAKRLLLSYLLLLSTSRWAALFIAARQTGFHEQSNQLKKNSIAIITAAVLEMSIPHSGEFRLTQMGRGSFFP